MAKCEICGTDANLHRLQFLDIKTDKPKTKQVCSKCPEKLANDDVETIARMWEVSTKVARAKLKAIK